MEIQFVLADGGEGLTWIAPMEWGGTVTVQTDDGECVHLTKLKGACTYDNVKLVWSVKPVYRVPCYDKYMVLAALQLEYKATAGDVIKHLQNISSGRADSKLFVTYTATTPGKNDISLINIIAKCFEFFNNLLFHSGTDCKLTDDNIRSLKVIPCIPVHVQATRDKVVLVKPCQALSTDHADKYYPYLHRIPGELMGSNQLLEKIQVKSSIQLHHLQLVLNLIYDELNNEAMDPNTMKSVCCVISDILHLRQNASNDNTAADQLSPLFLPGHDQKLHSSLKLVYPDTYGYKDCHLPATGDINYSLFHYPGSLEDHYDFAKKFCSSLPKAVRPKPLSEICSQQLTEDCTPLQWDNEMARCLKTALGLDWLPVACRLMFVRHGGDEIRHESLEMKLTDFFQRVEVTTVQNLKVNVVLKENSDRIGTTKVDFYLEQRGGYETPSFCLHLDSGIGRMEEAYIHRSMAQELFGALSRIIAPSNISSSEDIQCTFSLFLKAQTNDDLRKACQICDIGVDDSCHVSRLVPAIGVLIPEEWHYMLDQNMEHVFHPQEIVGYKTTSGQYIFAEVLYVVPPEDFQPSEDTMDPLQTRYMIMKGTEENVVVSALDIYKFLKGKRDNSSSALLPLQHEDRAQSPDETIADIKRKLCQELKQIWQLDKPEKWKAIRRLYLQWHPDKNLDNVEVADEVFKFLMRQIARLEQGLEPTEDEEDEDDDKFSPSPYWEEMRTHCEETVKTHRTHRQRHSEHFRNPSRSGGYRGFDDTFTDCEQPQRDMEKAVVWIQQAEIDFTALEVLYEKSTRDGLLYSHVCFMAHEVAEKALKGAMYALCGLHSMFLVNHDICTLAHAIKGERMELAHDLPSLVESLNRHYLNTRYPNRYAPCVVPSYQYSSNDATTAHESAKKILAITGSLIQS